jgi:hypothetical protein
MTAARHLAWVYGATLLLFLVVPALPEIAGTDAATLAAGIPALTLLAGCALVLLPLRDATAALALLALGAGMIGAALTEIGADAGANVAKALLAASVGFVLVRVLATPAVVIAVPLFVSAVDIASVLSGPSAVLMRGESGVSDFLTFTIPAFGGGRAGALGISDIIFLAFFAGCAWRYGLRRRTTAIALMLALPLALVAAVLAGRGIAALPFLSAALLLPNLDLLPGLLRSDRPE